MPDRIYFKHEQYVDFYEECSAVEDDVTYWYWQVVSNGEVVVNSHPFDTKQLAFNNLKLTLSVGQGALNSLPKVP